MGSEMCIRDRLQGLSLLFPHEPELAKIFFRHLKTRASADWMGFQAVLEHADSSTRGLFVSSFGAKWPKWKHAEASTNAAGYVARAREWGLLEQKLVDRKYLLTEFGRQVRDGKEI